MKTSIFRKSLSGMTDRILVFSPFVLTLAFCVVIVGCSGNRAKSQARKTARNSVDFTITDPSLKILAVGVADSVIDGQMFSEQDQRMVMQIMTSASGDVFASLYEEDDTDKLVEKFNSMTAATYDTSRLAQEIMIQSVNRSRLKPQGRLTGWRVKVGYETSADGKTVKMQRWCYLDPSGTSVVKSFDIPMTWKK